MFGSLCTLKGLTPSRELGHQLVITLAAEERPDCLKRTVWPLSLASLYHNRCLNVLSHGKSIFAFSENVSGTHVSCCWDARVL